MHGAVGGSRISFSVLGSEAASSSPLLPHAHMYRRNGGDARSSRHTDERGSGAEAREGRRGNLRAGQLSLSLSIYLSLSLSFLYPRDSAAPCSAQAASRRLTSPSTPTNKSSIMATRARPPPPRQPQRPARQARDAGRSPSIATDAGPREIFTTTSLPKPLRARS